MVCCSVYNELLERGVDVFLNRCPTTETILSLLHWEPPSYTRTTTDQTRRPQASSTVIGNTCDTQGGDHTVKMTRAAKTAISSCMVSTAAIPQSHH